jgi:triosephosphate isomerase
MSYLGVSLKTYKSIQGTIEYVEALKGVCKKAQDAGIVFFIIPDQVSLGVVPRPLAYDALLGAQDCYHEDNGAYTGTVSPANLAELGVRIVEIGHAERRRLFHETDEDVALKGEAAVRNGIIPLVCVGEQTEQPDPESAAQVCMDQIRAVTDRLSEEKEVVVAYEPVWAIGKPSPASPEYVVAVVKRIKEAYRDRKGSVKVIYGGSAGVGLYGKLAPTLDGLFLGRFGHDPMKVSEILDEAIQLKAKYNL